MYAQEHHEMLLATTHPTGVEEWFCPTCGRRFLLRWPPAYAKVILDPGDERAAHSGSKGAMMRLHALAAEGDEDLVAPGARRTPEEVGDLPITEELQPWLKWLSSVGLADPTRG